MFVNEHIIGTKLNTLIKKRDIGLPKIRSSINISALNLEKAPPNVKAIIT